MFDDFYRGKRVLVTGHTGFKGSWLCQWLLDLGAEVAGFSVDIPSRPSHFELLGLEKKIRHGVGDIRDDAALDRCVADFNPAVVFHMAAQALVRASYDAPKANWDTNVGGTVNVLEAVRKSPAIRVLVSVASDKCYENLEWEWGYRENDRLGGKDPYSASKACAEILFHSYFLSFFNREAGTRIASVRAGNVIGGGDWAADRIVPDCARAWSQGQIVSLRSPRSVRPWQHVLEPLSGYLALGAALGAGREGTHGEPFNFGPLPEANQTVETLIGQMEKTWKGREHRIDESGVGQKKEAGLLKLNCDRAHDRLGWKATLSFGETIEMTARWYMDYYDKRGDVAALTRAQIRQYEALARERGNRWASS